MTSPISRPLRASALALMWFAALAASGARALELASPSGSAGGDCGYAVAGLADVNGDGRGDILVGAPGETPPGGPSAAGRAFVFDGVTGELLYSVAAPAPESFSDFGLAVASVPDATGDGRVDLAIGAAGAGGDAEGKVFLFSGADGSYLRTLTTPAAVLFGAFGQAVAGVADADGDGRGDVAVGAPGEGANDNAFGAAYLYSGATGALLRTFISGGPVILGEFGNAIGGVPDVNGDGRGDVVVGAFGEGPNDSAEGRAYIFSGATGARLRTLISPAPISFGEFGSAAAGVPDLDSDGRGDVVIGAVSEGVEIEGRAYVYSGATGAFIRTLASPNGGFGGEFGISAAGARDLNGDGLGDIVIGASGETDGGHAYIFSGSSGALLQTLTAPGGAGSIFGFSVGAIRHSTGDLGGDAVIGDHFSKQFGRAYTFDGGTGAFINPPPINKAALIGHTLPARIPAGESRLVGITLQNLGNTTWSAANLYALGVTADACGAANGGINRVPPTGGESVAPGLLHQFVVEIKAPAAPGACSLQFRMVQEFVEFFGDTVAISFESAAIPNAAEGWAAYE